jgi:hypothetical protein
MTQLAVIQQVNQRHGPRETRVPAHFSKESCAPVMAKVLDPPDRAFLGKNHYEQI